MTEEVKDPSQQTSEAEESMKNAAEAAETDAAADVATETEAAAAEADKTAELQQKIEALEKELADEKEKYLRLDAEYYNYRTRSLKEKQDAYDNALTKAVTEVLSVIDNFERALTAECADANFKKGVEMIFRQYTAILEKLGVKEIEAEGKPFDHSFLIKLNTFYNINKAKMLADKTIMYTSQHFITFRCPAFKEHL